VPTLHESLGEAGFDLQTWIALFAPRGTPANRIARINADVQSVLAQPEIRASLENASLEPVAQSAAWLANEMRQESAKYADIVRRTRISLD